MECFVALKQQISPSDAADANKHEAAITEGNSFNRVKLFKLCMCKYKYEYNNKITCRE